VVKSLTTDLESQPFATRWLEEQIRLTETQLQRCERSLSLVGDSGSTYANGFRVMVAAHAKALAVYRAELAALTALDQSHG
jgi:hypothetical protein